MLTLAKRLFLFAMPVLVGAGIFFAAGAAVLRTFGIAVLKGSAEDQGERPPEGRRASRRSDAFAD